MNSTKNPSDVVLTMNPATGEFTQWNVDNPAEN